MTGGKIVHVILYLCPRAGILQWRFYVLGILTGSNFQRLHRLLASSLQCQILEYFQFEPRRDRVDGRSAWFDGFAVPRCFISWWRYETVSGAGLPIKPLSFFNAGLRDDHQTSSPAYLLEPRPHQPTQPRKTHFSPRSPSRFRFCSNAFPGSVCTLGSGSI